MPSFAEKQTYPIIGIFDSGVGGMSILKDFVTLGHQRNLSPLNIQYFADNAFCPYGEKSEEQIIERMHRVTQFFISQNIQLIVLACNTVTAVAIEILRQTYSNIQFVGVEPALKPAAQQTITNVIGVLATRRTLSSVKFLNKVRELPKHIKVKTSVGADLVTLVENGEETFPIVKDLLRSHLEPMLNENIDQLILGCTHYPFLLSAINDILPPHVTVHNPAPAIARRILSLVEIPQKTDQTQSGFVQFYSSLSTQHLELRCQQIKFEEEILSFFPNISI